MLAECGIDELVLAHARQACEGAAGDCGLPVIVIASKVFQFDDGIWEGGLDALGNFFGGHGHAKIPFCDDVHTIFIQLHTMQAMIICEISVLGIYV